MHSQGSGSEMTIAKDATPLRTKECRKGGCLGEGEELMSLFEKSTAGNFF
jgi:hypothetical protein